MWIKVRVHEHVCMHAFEGSRQWKPDEGVWRITLLVPLREDLSLNLGLIFCLSDWRPEGHSNSHLSFLPLKVGSRCSWSRVFYVGAGMLSLAFNMAWHALTAEQPLKPCHLFPLQMDSRKLKLLSSCYINTGQWWPRSTKQLHRSVLGQCELSNKCKRAEDGGIPVLS